MLAKIKNFFSPMWRTIWISLAGQGFFIVSVITMMPLRMWDNPVVNYNLFYLPILIILLGYLFYRCCTEEKEDKAYIYGFFAALLAWPVIGEMSSLPVEKGLITQFSDINIKGLGGLYFVIAGWLFLKVLWLTKALKNSACVFFMVFLAIWSFELYMDNYSSKVSLEMMPVIAKYVANTSLVIMLVILVLAKKTPSIEKKTVLGCCLYIFFALFLMGSDQWKVPSKFYATYEAAGINTEIHELQGQKEYLNVLKKHMLDTSLLDGKAMKYMLVRNLITEQEISDALAQGSVKGADAAYLLTNKVIKEEALREGFKKGFATAMGKGLIKVRELAPLIKKKLLSEKDIVGAVEAGSVSGKDLQGLYKEGLLEIKDLQAALKKGVRAGVEKGLIKEKDLASLVSKCLVDDEDVKGLQPR
ncbi:MAG: hypothetical protein WCQ99_00715 [Pseudomonadota bacterium]